MSVDNLAQIRAGLAKAPGLADFDPSTGTSIPRNIGPYPAEFSSDFHGNKLTVQTGLRDRARSTSLLFRDQGGVHPDSLLGVEWRHDYNSAARGLVIGENMTDNSVVRDFLLRVDPLVLLLCEWEDNGLHRVELIQAYSARMPESLTYTRGGDEWKRVVHGSAESLLHVLEVRSNQTGKLEHPSSLRKDPTDYERVAGQEIVWGRTRDELVARHTQKSRIWPIIQALGGEVPEGV